MSYRGVVLDLDGTMYRHREPIEGAAGTLDTLRDRNVEVLFFSNDPRARPAEYVTRLAELGISVAAEEVRSSASVTADFLTTNHPDDDVFLIGSAGLHSLLVDRGVTLTDDYADPDVVVGSWTAEFDYDTLTEGMWALEGDVPFLGTDPDVTVPIGDGRTVPGSGAILAALATVADREPRILGKPSAEAAQAVAEALDTPPDECLVVGDRVDTDIALGDRAGMATALVLTGVTDWEDIASGAVDPDHIIESVDDLPTLLE